MWPSKSAANATSLRNTTVSTGAAPCGAPLRSRPGGGREAVERARPRAGSGRCCHASRTPAAPPLSRSAAVAASRARRSPAGGTSRSTPRACPRSSRGRRRPRGRAAAPARRRAARPRSARPAAAAPGRPARLRAGTWPARPARNASSSTSGTQAPSSAISCSPTSKSVLRRLAALVRRSQVPGSGRTSKPVKSRSPVREPIARGRREGRETQPLCGDR